MLLQQKKKTCDSFSNLFAENPKRFRLARNRAKKLRPGVIAQKTLMQENCTKKLDCVIPA